MDPYVPKLIFQVVISLKMKLFIVLMNFVAPHPTLWQLRQNLKATRRLFSNLSIFILGLVNHTSTFPWLIYLLKVSVKKESTKA